MSPRDVVVDESTASLENTNIGENTHIYQPPHQGIHLLTNTHTRASQCNGQSNIYTHVRKKTSRATA